MSTERSNGSKRRENSVLFALDELSRIERERARREETERARREAERRAREEEEARLAASRARLEAEMAAAASRARAEAEARVAAELAALRAEMEQPAPAPASPVFVGYRSSRVPTPVRVVLGSVAVAAFSLFAAFVFVPRELHVAPMPGVERTSIPRMNVGHFVPLELETAVPESVPATGKVRVKKTRPVTSIPTTKSCKDDPNPLCGLDVGSAK